MYFYIALYLVGCIVTWIATSGWTFAKIRSDGFNTSEKQDLGMSILIGFFVGLFSFVGLMAAFLMTGFAEHGWKVNDKT